MAQPTSHRAALRARSLLSALPMLTLVALGACSGGESGPVAAHHPGFRVRGRWPDPVQLEVSLDPRGGPLPDEAFMRVIRKALARWAKTGTVTFQEVPWGEPTDVSIAWKRGDHGACPPFGPTQAVAHTGPVEPGTFIHFDAGHAWKEGGVGRDSLYVTALHEIGHLLGLGHSADSRSLMFADTTAFDLTASDLRGIHSLYGGGRLGSGDLVLEREEDAESALASADMGTSLILQRVAPPEVTSVLLFDTGGDGDDELLVWRTDEEGAGALTIYVFGKGPKLVETVGPLWSRVHTVPFAETYATIAPNGQRLLVSKAPGKSPILQRFKGEGRLEGVSPDAPDARRLHVLARGGKFEPIRPKTGESWTGDLDGDGRAETLVRRR